MKWILVLNNLFFRSPLLILGFCWEEDQSQELMEKNRASYLGILLERRPKSRIHGEKQDKGNRKFVSVSICNSASLSGIHLFKLYCLSPSTMSIIMSIFSCVILQEKLNIPNKQTNKSTVSNAEFSEPEEILQTIKSKTLFSPMRKPRLRNYQ